MAKVVDITDKLKFDENSKIVIDNIELEVNSDAETVIRVMGALAKEDKLQATNQALRLLFSPEDIEKICSLKKDGKKLSADGLMTIIGIAMELVMGESEGE